MGCGVHLVLAPLALRCSMSLLHRSRHAPAPLTADASRVKALLPEGQAVALRDKGITELPLAQLQPAVLLAALKVVLAGTTSLSVMLVRPTLPLLA